MSQDKSQALSYQDAKELEEVCFIDVRSPLEYKKDHIPGAINIPLLDDEERKIVGTLYKKEGKERARQEGFRLVLPSLNKKMDQLRALAKKHQCVLYCWRGGLRSQSLRDACLKEGFSVFKLEGGYKSYRKFVLKRYQEIDLPDFWVLYGLTGCAKTDILVDLEKRGLYTIDLEGLANHRGSVFGAVGLGQQPSQKAFESRLLEVLEKIPSQAQVLVEGESRKIGRLFIPERVFNHLKASPKILVYDSLDHRAQRIAASYTADSTQEELLEALSHLGRRIGKNKVAALSEKIKDKDYLPVVTTLLKDHYDPLYKHPSRPSDDYLLSLSSQDVAKASQEIEAFIKQKKEKGMML